MTDLERILPLWRELEASKADYVLATVVAVEGSSYRRPGARMLIAQDGRRVGTVSGGCLEAEVASRAWWLTANGPVVERYSTIEDEGERPYGSGCGGVVYLLLERGETASSMIAALEAAFLRRTPLAIATILGGPRIGHRAFAGASCGTHRERASAEAALESIDAELSNLAQHSLEMGASIELGIRVDGVPARVWADYRAARPGLWIFGAGDDARPLLHLARELGWFVGIADGRSHLATRERFAAANTVAVLDLAALPGPGWLKLDLRPTDAAVLMTHSFEQDARILASLHALDEPLEYVGVLGPQRRTRQLLAEAAQLLGLPGRHEERVEEWLACMHAPTGLDLGAETPAAIALSILAEMQQSLNKGTGQPLKEVRADRTAVARN
jgi:xanthine/CO dehydrogenase XdhC/CoxF family maturation factor